jgi:hypothetical protein
MAEGAGLWHWTFERQYHPIMARLFVPTMNKCMRIARLLRVRLRQHERNIPAAPAFAAPILHLIDGHCII